MRVPLIRISQNKEFIYSSKLNVKTLRKYVNLNFRQPYLDMAQDTEKELKRLNDYINKLAKKGLEVSYDSESVQRVLQIDRLTEIANYIKEESNFIPNSIIIGCFNNRVESKISNESYEDVVHCIDEELGIYYFDLDESYEMIAIDGQHRLGGYFLSGDPRIEEMEVPVVILFGPSPSICSKIFVDINGNQQPVDKSLIYDLTAVLENEFDNYKLGDKEIQTIKECHRLCKALYSQPKSPLYKQVRMLGTGKGAVSQAFIIESIYPIVKNGVLSPYSNQERFNALYYFLKSFQEVFQDDWPVLLNVQDENIQIEHARKVLSVRKSQLAKTLGLGALFLIFPYVFEYCQFNYQKYLNYAYRLLGKIIWSKYEHDKVLSLVDDGEISIHRIQGIDLPFYIEGTNKAAIKKLAKVISIILFDIDVFS